MTILTLRCQHRNGAGRECGRVQEKYEILGQFADGSYMLGSHQLGGACRKHPVQPDPAERLAEALRQGWRSV